MHSFYNTRRSQIYDLIKNLQIETFAEIGVASGDNAAIILSLPSIKIYYGFDLFEMMTDEIKEKEFSKRPLSMNDVSKKLSPLCRQNNDRSYILLKGFTYNTLPKFLDKHLRVQMWFIDGGHSLETMTNDFKIIHECIQPNDIIIFDEWNEWADDYKGPKWSVQPLIEQIKANKQYKYEITVLPKTDIYRDGKQKMKLVMLRAL